VWNCFGDIEDEMWKDSGDNPADVQCRLDCDIILPAITSEFYDTNLYTTLRLVISCGLKAEKRKDKRQ
jgi:hypothetical protein